ncbi:RDAC family protein [Candidatus Galacturonibacter soehngenii]|uniref:Uncharacterized protein n=1 Tax=Candidatus Galacturonatibacter soehngenii TaxID=2307010 RepID=A0A7V7QK39_9FIRM|nr:hypothetical protein [Candidatus Galacturonibacter soehngenii]KAB1438100.1 hypothetical protein F7O84_11105 [Candidatus Galacturonibacter soehngenii]
MKIVSISQIIEINNQLKEKGLPYSIHLKDACGGQSFSIEVINNETQEDKKKLVEFLDVYFTSYRMKVVYGIDQYHFTIQ